MSAAISDPDILPSRSVLQALPQPIIVLDEQHKIQFGTMLRKRFSALR